MTTQSEIDAQIGHDMQNFYDSVYDGFVPESFVEMFKKAIMHLAPAQHQYAMSKVKEMVSKRAGEHTVVETSMMINVIYSTPFHLLYESIERAIEVTMEFDKVRKEHNKKIQEMEHKLQAKRSRLLKLSGVGNSAPMKLIHGEA